MGKRQVKTERSQGEEPDVGERDCGHERGVHHVVRRLQVVEDSDERYDRDFGRSTDAAGGVGLCAGAVAQ